MDDIETALRHVISVHGSVRAAALKMGFSEDAAARVLAGEGVGGKNLARFRRALGLPASAPLRQPATVSGESDVTFGMGGSATGAVTLGHDYWLGRWEQQTLHLRRVLLDQEALLASMRQSSATTESDHARDAVKQHATKQNAEHPPGSAESGARQAQGS